MAKDRFLPRFDGFGGAAGGMGPLPCPRDPQWPPMPGYEHCFQGDPRGLAPCPPTLCEPVPWEMQHCVGRPGVVVLPQNHVDCGGVPLWRDDRDPRSALGRGQEGEGSIFDRPGQEPIGSGVFDDGRNTKPKIKSASVELIFPLIGASEVLVWFQGSTLSYAFVPAAGLVPGIGLAQGTPSGLTTQAIASSIVAGGAPQPAVVSYLDKNGNATASANGSFVAGGKAIAWTERIVSLPIEVSLAAVPFKVKTLTIVTAGSATEISNLIAPGPTMYGAPEIVKALANLPKLTAVMTASATLNTCPTCNVGATPLWPVSAGTQALTLTVEVRDA